MNTEKIEAMRAELRARCDETSKALNEFCEPYRDDSLPGYAVSDAIKRDETYQKLRKAYNEAFTAYRSFNQVYKPSIRTTYNTKPEVKPATTGDTIDPQIAIEYFQYAQNVERDGETTPLLPSEWLAVRHEE